MSRSLSALLLALLLLLPCAARGQDAPGKGAPQPGETFDLRPRWTAGERCEGEARLLLTLKMRLQLTGDPQHPLDRTSEQAQALLRRWQDEVVAVADERPIDVRRRYSEDYEGLREPGARAMERTQAPLHQRRVRLDLDEQRLPRARVVGEPAVEAEALAEERPGERYEAVLPREKVAVGHTWTIAGEAMREALGKGLGEDVQGQIVCTLRTTAEAALDEDTPAERLALIDLVVTAAGAKGKEPDAPRIETELKGTLRFSLARRKVVALELDGTARLHQVRREGEVTLDLDGKGPLELKKRYWFPERPRKGEKPPGAAPDPGPELEPPRGLPPRSDPPRDEGPLAPPRGAPPR